MLFLEIPQLTDTSDHGVLMYLTSWLTYVIGGAFAFVGAVIYGEYKIWTAIKKNHIEKNSKEALEKEERISNAVKTISSFRASIEKIEVNYTEIKENQAEIKEHYETTKESWSKIESDYRHIRKSLEVFNDNTPRIQEGLMSMLEEMKAEVKKVEAIKMAQEK